VQGIRLSNMSISPIIIIRITKHTSGIMFPFSEYFHKYGILLSTSNKISLSTNSTWKKNHHFWVAINPCVFLMVHGIAWTHSPIIASLHHCIIDRKKRCAKTIWTTKKSNLRVTYENKCRSIIVAFISVLQLKRTRLV
jgi:hypothetical protein